MSDFPTFVHIYEMGPREGFQIESAAIKTDDKVRFIDALSDTGVPKMQMTAFVSPKQEMGIDTGINLAAMIECAKMAEDIVGHVLPGHLSKALGLPRRGTKLFDMDNQRTALA